MSKFSSREVAEEAEQTDLPGDSVMEKITLAIGGQKVIIDHGDPAKEAETAARLLSATTSVQTSNKSVASVEDSPTLARMIKDFLSEKKETEGWTAKTTEENEAIYQLLQEALKNPSVGTIGIKQASEFKSILLRIPANRTKGVNRGKSIKELLSIPQQNKMSVSTVNKYLRRISSLFAWGVKHGKTHENPFQDLSIRDPRRRHTLRSRFTILELEQLFSVHNHRKSLFDHSYQYWLPWLGLYTGARLEELCQLHLDDIREENGIWLLDINDREGKRLKSSASERLIPLHEKMVSKGFIAHVVAMKSKGEERLFPELKLMRDGYSQAASKWFGRHRLKIGIEKPFHSLRHTFVDELRQLGADHKKIAALVGHTDSSMTGGTYGKPFLPEVLRPVVQLLNFSL